MAPPPTSRFPTTHWTLVAEAGRGSDDVKRAALDRLLRLYTAPLRSYLVKGRRMNPDAADEVLGEFLTEKVIDRNIVERAERHRGRFRNFLLASLSNFTSNWLRDRRVARAATACDEIEGVRDARAERPDRTFDIEWARLVIAQALDLMRSELLARGRERVWTVFEARVLGPALRGSAEVPYRELVARLGLVSPSEASNLLVNAKRSFRSALEAVVGGYERDAGAIEEEMTDLWRILSGGRAG